MPGKSPEYEKITMYTLIAAGFILAINLYYYAFPLFARHGLVHEAVTHLMLSFREAGFFKNQYITKGAAALLMMLGGLIRTGKSTEKGWSYVLTFLGTGALLYFFPSLLKLSGMYIFTTITGFVLMSIGFFTLSRKFKGEPEDEEGEEGFEQCRKKIENKMSINIPTKFWYQKKYNDGWINIVSPQRATMIMGTPGAGKSYSVFEPVIEQCCAKGYSMFVYDYKYDDLSRIVYNELRDHLSAYKVKPHFGVINFKDPRYSHRCNPLRPEYITDPADTTEIAENVMQNVNKAAVEKEDFFSMSAKVYLDALLWFLKIYTPEGKEQGAYCTFPHVIELMAQDYKKVFEILKSYPELQVKISPFANALEGGAQDQLQGQIASAQIPLNKFVSPILYWILSKNEINLDINNPEHPMVLCVGNDPERQAIYGTTLALITSQMFKVINKKKRLHSAVILDELPTIFLKGLDNLIATARSNKVCIFLGIQDISQLKRYYGDKESTVILNTVGNLISGQVLGETANNLSRSFGKRKRKNVSHSIGEESDSRSISYHEEEILPIYRIETASQGEMFGRVADANGQKIKHKLFWGDVQRPDFDTLQKQREDRGWTDIPMVNDFGLDEIKEDIKTNFDEYVYDACEKEYKAAHNDWNKLTSVQLGLAVEELQADKMKDSDWLKQFEAELTDRLWKKKIDDTIKENFNSIKQDIKELVDREYTKVIEKKNQITKDLKEKKQDELLKRHDEMLRQRNQFKKNIGATDKED